MLEMPQLKKTTEPFQRIAFLGPMCSGKTWAASYLVDNYGYTKISFADKLKTIAYDLYGVQNKDARSRALLQELGQDIRKHDVDVWIKIALYKADYLAKQGKSLVIDDLRYTNEAKVLKRNGFVLLRMSCDEADRQERIKSLYPDYTNGVHNHPSEQEWKEMIPYTSILSDGYNTMAELDVLLESQYADSVRR